MTSRASPLLHCATINTHSRHWIKYVIRLYDSQSWDQSSVISSRHKSDQNVHSTGSNIFSHGGSRTTSDIFSDFSMIFEKKILNKVTHVTHGKPQIAATCQEPCVFDWNWSGHCKVMRNMLNHSNGSQWMMPHEIPDGPWQKLARDLQPVP
jgi:hypothetical protein